MDLDTTSGKNAHERLLQKFGTGGADILLGTQMVAKGLDFPRVTLVGVISADTQMMLPDFRSAERTFQLLTQVAGRAGRSVLHGEVILQTSQPDHYALTHVKSLQYPPFSRIIAIEVRGPKESEVEMTASDLGAKLRRLLKDTAILGPSPAQLAKIKNEYRWQIIIKADKRNDKNGHTARTGAIQTVHTVQQAAPGRMKITIDVDPAGLL